jgi:type II secretory ATPase GspE/PulE/Tfp pilus assembly ATPase PilB-like protein
MRAFLRADPDVIMIGEMRDPETAGVAIEASLTGHLVFSTLHTNSAPETVVRLLDMGMDPFNFSDALVGVLSQRLARKLCIECRRSYVAPDEELLALAREYAMELRELDDDDAALERRAQVMVQEWRDRHSGHGDLRLYRAGGCDKCEGNGYAGRLAVHELLLVNDPVRYLIQRKVPTDELRAAGIREGMRTLRQDGIEKVVRGLTEAREVRRVCAR